MIILEGEKSILKIGLESRTQLPQGLMGLSRFTFEIRMVTGMKSSGFNIEDTHVTDLERVERIILLTMVAYVWCYKIGDFIDANIKPIRIQKNTVEAISVFKYGLDYLASVLITNRNKLNLCLLQFLSCT